MDSPGGSTPRTTPVRMTPLLPHRGHHQPKSAQSSSLLEDVLAEKKMALMQSPEVIQWLQEFQQQVKASSSDHGQISDVHQPVATSEHLDPTSGYKAKTGDHCDILLLENRTDRSHLTDQQSGTFSQFVSAIPQESVYQMSDPGKARLVSQWLNDNVHPVPQSGTSRETHLTSGVSQQIGAIINIPIEPSDTVLHSQYSHDL